MTYSSCTLCPRNCKVDRNLSVGFCRETADLRVARAALHFWEEPCISGKNGSGTVFFVGCNLRCCYCQNSQISTGNAGKVISVDRLCEIFLELQQKGAENINLVTPTHFVLHIIKAIKLAKGRGLQVPIVYNCGGYESVETLKLLDGYIDVYLPDFKYYDERFAIKYSSAPNYKEIAEKTIEEMVRQVGSPQFDERGMMKKGVIVRHLCLPTLADDSKRVLKFLHRTFGNDVYISIMSQYTPTDFCPCKELQSPLDREDYEEILEYCADIGIEQGFTQDEGCAEESFIPPFDLTGVD